jgi:hypothetical protein
VIFNVWWEEDPTKTRDVTGWCKTCARSLELGGDRDIYLVSPQGVAHHVDGWHGDRTICGHDATGPEWWWRS